MKTISHTDPNLIEKIIRKCDICFVGVVTPDNLPYVIPMNFGFHNNTIYLHSAPNGKIIDCLENNPNVCVTFSTDHKLAFQHPEVACSYRMKSKSVMAFGKVSFISDLDQKREALNIIMSQYSDKNFIYNDPAVQNVKIWIIPVDKITCKEFGAPHNAYQENRK